MTDETKNDGASDAGTTEPTPQPRPFPRVLARGVIALTPTILLNVEAIESVQRIAPDDDPLASASRRSERCEVCMRSGKRWKAEVDVRVFAVAWARALGPLEVIE